MPFEIPISLDIPIDLPCPKCGSTGNAGDERVVILSAGSAWKDGYAELSEGAELYTAQVYCKDHAPEDDDA
jgi:hypothetical protein